MGPYSSGAKTFTAGEALARGRRVKLSSGTVIYADADEMAIGVTMADVASGEVVGVRLLGGQTHKVTASAAVSASAVIYGTADGKVDDAGAGSGSAAIVVALEDALADGDLIEVILNAEVVEVVIPEPLGPGGIDEFTKLMLNMNTVDFTDSSGEENEPSFPWDTPTVAAGDSGFDKCGVFVGNTATAIKFATPTLVLGAGNWVFDTKVYGLSDPYNFLFDYRYATNDLLILGYSSSSGQWQLYEYEDGWGAKILWTADQTLSATAWHHVALVRSGNVVRLMVNGEKVGNDYAFAKTVGAATKFYVGGTDSGSGLAGKMDEFRLSVGTDRDWAGGFTPPASPYTVV